MGVTPVLSATPGDGYADLSWTDWIPPESDLLSSRILDYGWRVKGEGDADWSEWEYVTETPTTVDDLENGKAYTFQVGGRERSVMVDMPVLRQSFLSNEVTVTPKAPEE